MGRKRKGKPDDAAREATLAESIEELGVGRSRTVKSSARPVKVTAKDGTVTATIPHGELVARMSEREGIESKLRDRGLEQAIKTRRAQGIPDTCEVEGCRSKLGMGREAIAARDARPHPWQCHRCAAKPGQNSHAAKLTELQAREILRRARDGERIIDLAKAFGISSGAVGAIKRRQTWRYLDDGRPGAVARAAGPSGILMDVNESTIAPNLRAARLDAGVRVGELARRMGCRPSTVCRIEAGQNALLESTIQRYAGALGFDVEFRLIPRAEGPTP